MAFHRPRLKHVVASLLLFATLLSLAIIASQVQQRLFRRRAERLLSQIRAFELRRTPWPEAQRQLEEWEALRTFSKPCDARYCSLEITLRDPVYRFVSETNLTVKLDDYFRWKLGLHYDTGPFVRLEFALLQGYLRFGGHPAQVTASIGMRDGVVWKKSFGLRIETYGNPAYWSPPEFILEFPLIVDLYSVPRFQYRDGRGIHNQLYLHPNYQIGRPGGCTICVYGWVRFTPYTDPDDVQRLMQLDLSCLTRWRPCVSQAEIMPVAWSQYNSELSRMDTDKSVLACTPSLLRLMGRDATNVAVVRIVHSHTDAGRTTWNARVLESLKGADLKVGGTLVWTVRSTAQIPGPHSSEISPMLLFLGADLPKVDPPHTCEGSVADEGTLEQVRDYARDQRTFPL
jgi:hypothetical protein